MTKEDQNYEESEGATKPTRAHLGKLEQGNIKEQREIWKKLSDTTASMVIKQYTLLL